MEIISRAEAKRLGLRRFYTGRPCRRAHDSERQTSSGHCLQCGRENAAASAQRRPDEVKANQARWQTANKERMLWLRARNRAKKSGVPFAIQISDVVIPPICPILGIPLAKDMRAGTGRGSSRQNSPSLDRVLPDCGYVPGNVRVISTRANRMKQDCTVEHLEAILRYMKDGVAPQTPTYS
jgi:hypothetical protein